MLEYVVFLIAFNPTDPSGTVGVLFEYEGENAMQVCLETAMDLNNGVIGLDSLAIEEPVEFTCEGAWSSSTVEWG